MSDGCAYVMHRNDAVGKLVRLLSEHSMTLDGDPLQDAIAELQSRESKLRLVKREDEP